jgi:Flp pilus assembly pilin Flp
VKIDHSNEGPSRALSRERRGFRRLRGDERGQATVEFALILFPLLILVSGIIYFGIGLNYWLDMNRIANQGARWAVVNNWAPECLRTDTTCTQTPACSGVARTRVKLQNTLKCMATTKGLKDGVQVDIC